MPFTFFVSNISKTLELETLYQTLADFAPVLRLDLLQAQNRENGRMYSAIVQFDVSDPLPVTGHFNGREYLGQYLSIHSMQRGKSSDSPQEIQAQAESIAAQLGETERHPIEQIKKIVRFCGKDFVLALLAETMQIEANGGMMLPDNSRRRTPGGILFLLAKERVSEYVRIQIFPTYQERAEVKAARKASQQKKNEQPSQHNNLPIENTLVSAMETVSEQNLTHRAEVAAEKPPQVASAKVTAPAEKPIEKVPQKAQAEKKQPPEKAPAKSPMPAKNSASPKKASSEVIQNYQNLLAEEKDLLSQISQPNAKGRFSLTMRLTEVKRKILELKRLYPDFE